MLVDSRETSVSFAKIFLMRSGIESLGRVEHIRGMNFGDRFATFLNMMLPGDMLLIAVHYLPADQLEKARSYLDQGAFPRQSIVLASYECFGHMTRWCADIGCQFSAIPYKRRTLPKSNCNIAKIASGPRKVGLDHYDLEDIDRIWIQYRLMLAIVSRSASLSDFSRQLILGEPVSGESLENERKRALRYYQLGEPDMAGGTYLCEPGGKPNPVDVLRTNINKIAATDFNVLVYGESGSGKEVVAWAIHEISSRRDRPFIALNCAGIPEELLESELFGYTKSSHNLAYEDSPGLLGAVDGGTLFLDELPEMSPRIQSKLLRFLENGEFRPLGALENRYADVRIIAAGQPERLNLRENVRLDLKNRIGQLDVSIMSLREMEIKCPGTISKIAYILLERMTWTTVYLEGRRRELTPKDIALYQEKLSSRENASRISTFPWCESNSRELNNFLRKWIVFGDDELIRLDKKNNTFVMERSYDCRPAFYDNALYDYFSTPATKDELKELLAKKPFHNLKRSYVRHLYEIYSKIIEKDNESLDTPVKATQKELARLMGVTENTICRYLN